MSPILIRTTKSGSVIVAQKSPKFLVCVQLIVALPMEIFKYLISFISGFLYRAGGSDQWAWCPIPQGMWRKFIGILIGIFFALYNGSLIPLLCILTY